MKVLSWYIFRQNNSGGSFICNDKVCKYVFIQEESVEKANEKALSIGIYFNGVEDGFDCYCCGDRWCEAADYDIIKQPYKFYEKIHTNIEDYVQELIDFGSIDTTPTARLYYADGTVSELNSNQK